MPTTRYFKASASGSGDGTSWNNAYTSQATAVAALVSGDTLLIDGDIIGGFPTISGVDNLVVDGGQGPSGTATILGMLQIDVEDISSEGGGIYSFALATAPPTLGYDYKRDDEDGTVTGINTQSSEIAARHDGMQASPPNVRAWYGHLPRDSTFATTTPSEGFWGYTGGRVYVYPPGSPSGIGEVQEKLRYGTNARGAFDLSGCDDPTLKNFETVAFCNATPQNGSIFTNGCLRVTIVDVKSYDAGYRSFNLEGDTGADEALGHRLVRCVSCGDTIVGSTINNAFVVYNMSGATNADVVIDNCAIVAYPWLGVDGAPIIGSTSGDTPMSQTYKPGGFYTHGGAGEKMGGIVLRDFSFISMCQALNEKHNLSMFWPQEGPASFPDTSVLRDWDREDVNDWPVQFIGLVGHCNPGDSMNVAYRRSRIIVPLPGGALANYENGTVGKQDWVALTTSGVAAYFEACEIKLFRKNAAGGGCFRSTSINTKLFMDLCTVGYECSTVGFDTDRIYLRQPGLPASVNTRFRQCVFAQPGGAASQRQFLTRGSTGPTSGVNWPDHTYQGLEVEACWFFNCGTNFFYRGGSVSADGTTYASFIDNAGGSPIDPTGFLITDPEFVDFANGDLRPEPGGNLDSARLDPPLAALEGVIGIYGGVYDGRYGADQGKPAKGRKKISLSIGL